MRIQRGVCRDRIVIKAPSRGECGIAIPAHQRGALGGGNGGGGHRAVVCGIGGGKDGTVGGSKAYLVGSGFCRIYRHTTCVKVVVARRFNANGTPLLCTAAKVHGALALVTEQTFGDRGYRYGEINFLGIGEIVLNDIKHTRGVVMVDLVAAKGKAVGKRCLGSHAFTRSQSLILMGGVTRNRDVGWLEIDIRITGERCVVEHQVLYRYKEIGSRIACIPRNSAAVEGDLVNGNILFKRLCRNIDLTLGTTREIKLGERLAIAKRLLVEGQRFHVALAKDDRFQCRTMIKHLLFNGKGRDLRAAEGYRFQCGAILKGVSTDREIADVFKNHGFEVRAILKGTLLYQNNGQALVLGGNDQRFALVRIEIVGKYVAILRRVQGKLQCPLLFAARHQ